MDPAIITMMNQQKQQHLEQMMQSHMMSSQNSAQEHQQKMLGMSYESQRAITNDHTKRSNEMQADSMSLLKEATQKLDSGASA
ncbi:hypothetical protein [Ochrobactrum sp. Marseille-Q0166]|uniref:hypothetical protein n=1 Tax=Ochrobactrum sp. Marseille-Q0166 TaxID=2761105 RepID=UPI0016556EDE|nr:hypothetical protein [Ochrobactrum sp. Marseille-Q0166]MBC8719577.1 hypothetical protein [Ochrobactrum sp. Marseille-Q0166]